MRQSKIHLDSETYLANMKKHFPDHPKGEPYPQGCGLGLNYNVLLSAIQKMASTVKPTPEIEEALAHINGLKPGESLIRVLPGEYEPSNELTKKYYNINSFWDSWIPWSVK